MLLSRESSDLRASERNKRIVLSAGANVFAKAISVGSALISLPLTLDYLGPERFGVWVTMTSFLIMLSFLDLGVGNGLLNAVAAASGRDDRADMRHNISSGYLTLLSVALAVVLATALAHAAVPWRQIFNVNSDLAISEAGPAMTVLLLCFAGLIPLGLVQKVQVALQQGLAASLWQCGGSLIGLGGLLLAIRMEGGLPWLVAAYLGGPLAAAAFNTLMYFTLEARDISPSLRFATAENAIRLARQGFLFMLLQLATGAFYSSDNLILAQILGADRVSEYALPAQIFALITSVLGLGLAPLWQAYREAMNRADHAWVARMLKRSILFAMMFAAAASMFLVFAGPSILAFWVGAVVKPSISLLLGFAVCKTLEAGVIATAMFMNGRNMILMQTIVISSAVVAGILLKIVLVGPYGATGLVWATAASILLCMIVPLAFLVPRMTRVPT